MRRQLKRARRILPEVVKFAVVGGLGYFADVLVFNYLRISLGSGPLLAKTISLCVATTIAFVGNRWWTYRDRASGGGAKEQYAAFFAFNLGGMLIQLACLGTSHYLLGYRSVMADNISGSLIGMAFATVFRFWGYRTWVFRQAVATSG